MVNTKRKRGKTMMRLFSLSPNEKVEVEFNELGQPIGTNSKYLSSYLGTLAREMVPMNISDWKKVDDKLKADLWTRIQARFKLDAIYKNMFLMMLGQRWKESKSRLVSAIRVASRNPDTSNKLNMLKPDNIKCAQEWNNFINEKLTKEFELKSNKYKAIRAKNTIPHTMSRKGYARLAIPHTMSRKGYARLADDIRKESDCPSDISRDDLWCRGHTKKNGEPPNSVVADYINIKGKQNVVEEPVTPHGNTPQIFFQGNTYLHKLLNIHNFSHIGVATMSQMVVMYKLRVSIESENYWGGKEMLLQKQQLHLLILPL